MGRRPSALAETQLARNGQLRRTLGDAPAVPAWGAVVLRVIDKEGWLDIKRRTDDRINRARTEYNRLTGSATVFGDIPPSDAVRDAWEQWNTDRRRAAVKAVLSRVTVSPDAPGRKGSRDRALRMEALRQRTEFDWRL